MKTFKRICIKDFPISNDDISFVLKRGEEYLTSREIDGYLTVFSKYWIHNVPADIFAGEQQFTGPTEEDNPPGPD